MDRDEYLSALRPRTIDDVTPDELALHSRILTAIRRRGGVAGRHALLRSLSVPAADLAAALDALADAGLVVVEWQGTAGRPATLYRLVEQ
jgi:predicted ArsR family transcriptional regulator